MSDSYAIPIVDLQAQYQAIAADIRAAIDEVLGSQQFVLGPAVRRFESEMARYLGVRHAIGVASGSDALLLALMALEMQPGDIVIVPPFTFFSTASAVTRLGGKPLFVDIDEDSYLLSPQALRTLLTRRTRRENGRTIERQTGAEIKAVIPVHLFGQCCAMEQIQSLAREFGLRIIEDVAQACGARMALGGRQYFAGSMGDIGCFSFFPSKTLGAYGDGGLVTSADEALGQKLRTLRTHGESEKYHHAVIGINSRLDSIQAAVLAVKQHFLDAWCAARIARARAYAQLFVAAELLGADKVIAIPEPAADSSHVFNNYVIRVARRDSLKSFLRSRGIQSEIYYPVALHLQKCFAGLGYGVGDFPNAELAARQVLALPLYPELHLEQQQFIVNSIEEFFRA